MLDNSDIYQFFFINRNPARMKRILIIKYVNPFAAVAVPKSTIAFPSTAITVIIFLKIEFRAKAFLRNNWNNPRNKAPLTK